MNDVCQLLKESRLGKGLSLDEVAQRTYIKLHYLEALEEGQLDKLPAMVHTYGYIRQYAKLLGLDGGSLVAQFQQQEQRSVSQPKAARTPTAELFNDTLNFLKPIKTTYGNGNGNGAGYANGHGGYAPTPTMEPPTEAPATAGPELPTPTPHVPYTSHAPYSPPPAAYTPPAPSYVPPAAPPYTPPSVAYNPPAPQAPPAQAYTPAPIAPPPPAPVAPPPHAPSFFRSPAEPGEIADARAQAQQILLAAEREARDLVRGAENYADEVLGQLEAEVGATLATVQNGRQFIAARRRSTPPGADPT